MGIMRYNKTPFYIDLGQTWQNHIHNKELIMQQNLLTRKQVALTLGVSPKTVKSFEKKKLIKPIGYINGRPRYTADSVEAVVKKSAND
jgi:hypothetical protein